METYTVGEFKSKFSAILEKVSKGEKVAVSYGKAKKIIAYFVPTEKKRLKKRQIGTLEGKIKVKFNGNWQISPEELFDL